MSPSRKRTAEQAGATDDVAAFAKRRLHQTPAMRKMPGAWPKDDDDFGEYVYTAIPVPALSPIPIIRSIIRVFNPIRILSSYWPSKPLPAQTEAKVTTPPPPYRAADSIAQKHAIPTHHRYDSAFSTPQQQKSPLRTAPQQRDAFTNFFDLPSALANTPERNGTPLGDFTSYLKDTPQLKKNGPLRNRKQEAFNNKPGHLNFKATLNILEKRQQKQRTAPKGWGSAQYCPLSIVPTPVKERQAISPHSARRWSPYHYEHRVTRVKNGILRSAKPSYSPFEKQLNIPSPAKYIDEISPVDDEGDNGMLDAADIPIKENKVRLSDRYPSWLTGEPLDSKNGVGHYFVSSLAINEKYGPTFEGYREDGNQELQDYDPDTSLLESPKPPGFDQEQKKSPGKYYFPHVGAEFHESLRRWEEDRKPDLKPNLSASMRGRYEKLFQAEIDAQNKAESAARHAKLQEVFEERKAREREAALKRQEQEERENKAREIQATHAEQELLLEAQKAAEEKAKADWRDAEERHQKRRLLPDNYSENPMDNPVLAKCLAPGNPGEIVNQALGLSRHDFGTLCPANLGHSDSGWLNDNIVNTFLLNMVQTANKKLGHDTSRHDKPAPYWTFNSGWYNKIGDGSGISRWSAKRGVNLRGTQIWGARKIFFPVCHQSHWTVTIVDPRTRTIEVLNSMGAREDSSHNTAVRNAVLRWLRYELGADYMDVEWQTHPVVCRQQSNPYDCGVFTIMHALARLSGTPTWSMRSQINPGTMSQCRSWAGGVLANGGFEFEGDFKLSVAPSVWQGTLREDPDYYGPLAHH